MMSQAAGATAACIRMRPMLALIGGSVAVAFLVGAVACRHRAPAVATACTGGLWAGASAVYTVVQHPGPDAPAMIALVASGGVGVGGLFGLLFRPRGDARRLRNGGIAALVAAPITVVGLAASLAQACPLYDERRSAGLCRYSIDVLGGWVWPTAVLGGLDVIVIGLLLVVSARLTVSDRR
jgi:hypothetical protein